jgi:hypothetical protein
MHACYVTNAALLCAEMLLGWGCLRRLVCPIVHVHITIINVHSERSMLSGVRVDSDVAAVQ